MKQFWPLDLLPIKEIHWNPIKATKSKNGLPHKTTQIVFHHLFLSPPVAPLPHPDLFIDVHLLSLTHDHVHEALQADYQRVLACDECDDKDKITNQSAKQKSCYFPLFCLAGPLLQQRFTNSNRGIEGRHPHDIIVVVHFRVCRPDRACCNERTYLVLFPGVSKIALLNLLGLYSSRSTLPTGRQFTQ
jgi:hypothetical protein